MRYPVIILLLLIIISAATALSIKGYTTREHQHDGCEITVDVSHDDSPVRPETYRLMLNKKPMVGGMDLHYAQCDKKGSHVNPFEWETVKLSNSGGAIVKSSRGSGRVQAKDCEAKVSATHQQLHRTDPYHRAVTQRLRTATPVDDIKLHLMALVESVCEAAESGVKSN